MSKLRGSHDEDSAPAKPRENSLKTSIFGLKEGGAESSLPRIGARVADD